MMKDIRTEETLNILEEERGSVCDGWSETAVDVVIRIGNLLID